LLNSRLRNDWIKPVDTLNGPVYAGIALGAVAAVASGFWFVPALFALGIAWLGACTLIFAQWHYCTSISTPLVGMCVTALLIIAERYRLRERVVVVMRILTKENEALQTELNQAGEIARAFIPAKVPKWPGFTIGVFHRPLSSASGDWYAFERSQSGRYLHFLMCDISGHGAQAAIIVSTCKTVLSMLVAQSRELLESDQFVAHYAKLLNDTLCVNGGGHHTTTFLGLTYEVVGSAVHCVCAGHPRPILLRHRDRQHPAVLGQPATLLGIMPALTFQARSYLLDPGDSVLAYTDGVPFPRSLVKVSQIFEKYRHLDADSGAKYMAVEARERQQEYGRLAEDDVSLVWFRWGTGDPLKQSA
jgi:serine phosphatase RsbU (regulator of sigma subunit)